MYSGHMAESNIMGSKMAAKFGSIVETYINMQNIKYLLPVPDWDVAFVSNNARLLL